MTHEIPHRRIFVAGEWRKTDENYTVSNPYDGKPVCTVSQATAKDVEDAIAGAVKSFEATKKLATYERASICRRTALALAARKDELAMMMIVEGGKPFNDARAEVDRGVHCFETAASECETMGGEMMPLDLRAASAGRFGVTKRVTVGPVTAISPFNF